MTPLSCATSTTQLHIGIKGHNGFMAFQPLRRWVNLLTSSSRLIFLNRQRRSKKSCLNKGTGVGNWFIPNGMVPVSLLRAAGHCIETSSVNQWLSWKSIRILPNESARRQLSEKAKSYIARCLRTFPMERCFCLTNNCDTALQKGRG